MIIFQQVYNKKLIIKNIIFETKNIRMDDQKETKKNLVLFSFLQEAYSELTGKFIDVNQNFTLNYHKNNLLKKENSSKTHSKSTD
jgi:hypothetical protein